MRLSSCFVFFLDGAVILTLLAGCSGGGSQAPPANAPAASLSQSVQSNQDSVRIASEQYAGGTVGYLSLLDAQRSLLRTQDTQVQSQGAVTLSMIGLYKAVGGGWEKVEEDEAQSRTALSKQ